MLGISHNDENLILHISSNLQKSKLLNSFEDDCNNVNDDAGSEEDNDDGENERANDDAKSKCEISACEEFCDSNGESSINRQKNRYYVSSFALHFRDIENSIRSFDGSGKLQDFDYWVEHRSATEMLHADALSRYAMMMIEDDLVSNIRRTQSDDEELKTIKDILKSQQSYNE